MIQILGIDATDLKAWGKENGKQKTQNRWQAQGLSKTAYCRRYKYSWNYCSRSKFIDGSVWEGSPEYTKTQRSIPEVSGDGAYDTRACHAAIKIKGAIAPITHEKWQLSETTVTLEPRCGLVRNDTSQISIEKMRYGHHKRSLSGTAMYRVQQLLEGNWV